MMVTVIRAYTFRTNFKRRYQFNNWWNEATVEERRRLHVQESFTNETVSIEQALRRQQERELALCVTGPGGFCDRNGWSRRVDPDELRET